MHGGAWSIPLTPPKKGPISVRSGLERCTSIAQIMTVDPDAPARKSSRHGGMVAQPSKPPRSVLFIDTSYTVEQLRGRKQLEFFDARGASGYFSRIWSVHPIADIVSRGRRRIGLHRLNPRHLVIEGRAELLKLPKLFFPVNFLVSQIRLIAVLSRLIRRHDITLVMAAEPFYSSLIGLFLARRHRKRFAVRITGNYDDIYEGTGELAMPRLLPTYPLQRAVQRFVLKRTDLVAAVNRSQLDYARANGAKCAGVVIPLSSNIGRRHLVSPPDRQGGRQLLHDLGLPTDLSKLLYVGRLIKLKHPEDALRAMASVIASRPNCVGLFAGTGNMDGELRALAKQLGVASSIHFLGQLDQETLCGLMPECIMLSPSAGQIALLEGALAGMAIVAYDRDFQPEFIEDGVDGFIVPYRDHVAMADRVALIAADGLLRRRLSENIRNKALAHLDPAQVRTIEWAAFDQILSS